MDWQTIGLYAGAALLAVMAIRLAFIATINAWVIIGVTTATLAMAVQILPGLLAGRTSMHEMINPAPGMSAQQIDKHREIVRRDITRRATKFHSDPNLVRRVIHGQYFG